MLSCRVLVVCLCVVALLPACVSEPEKPRLQPRRFATIAIVSPVEFTKYISPESKTDKAMQGASAGSGTAGLRAMAVGALACGPFLYALCVSGAGLAAMAVGGLGGLMYGVTGISEEDLHVLDRKLHALEATGGQQNQLTDMLRERLPKQMLATGR